MGERAAELDFAALPGTGTLLQRYQAHARHPRERCGGREREGARVERRELLGLGIAVPVEPDLASRQLGQAFAPGAHRDGIDLEIGDAARNRVDLGAQGERQAQERDVQVIFGEQLAAAHQGTPHGERTQERLQSGLHLEDDASTPRFKDGKVAAELQRVSESLIGMHQQGLARQRLRARPARRRERALQLPHVCQSQTRFVERPAVAKLSHRELQQRLGPGGRHIVRPDRERAIEVAECLLVAPQAPERNARVGEGLGIVGPQGDAAREVRESIVGPEQPHQHRTAVVERIR